jgi:hypothetical protein
LGEGYLLSGKRKIKNGVGGKYMIPCEVYNDLIMLYVSEECTECTRQLVEEHLKACPNCQKYYQGLLEPITQVELEPDLLEEKVKEFEVKKSFLKIRKRWFISLVSVVLILGLTISIGYLTYNQVRGQGICFTNPDELMMSKSFIKAIKNGNYEKAFSMLNIEKMYKYITFDQVENLVHLQGRLYSVEPIHEWSMDEKEVLINKVTMCSDYYRKMGFKGYKEKQWKEFLRRMENMKSQGVTITDYTIDAIYYMKNVDNGKGCWDIDFKVKCSNQDIGWITLRIYNGALLIIDGKWSTNMLQNNLFLPEDVENFYTYTYTGERELWNAELKVIETPKFTKTDSGLDVKIEAKRVLVITYNGELADLSSSKNIEITYRCNDESYNRVSGIIGNISSKTFTLNSVITNGILYDGDDIITVFIGANREVTLSNGAMVSSGDVLSVLKLRSK